MINTIVKLTFLAWVIIGLSACGKMGELEPIKVEVITAVWVETHHA